MSSAATAARTARQPWRPYLVRDLALIILSRHRSFAATAAVYGNLGPTRCMEIVLFLKATATIAYAISLTAGDDGICRYPVKNDYSIVKIVKFLIKSE
jgi:hypothetical protein